MSLSVMSRTSGRAAVLATCAVMVAAGAAAVPTATASGAPTDRGGAAAAARAFASAAKPLPRPGTYLVVMKQEPSASYAGGTRGYPATTAANGRQFRADATATRRYERLLRTQQDRVLARVGQPRTLYRHTTALNGFTADLTSGQVVALRKDPAVLSVERDRLVHATTVHTPEFLGLTGPDGVWRQNGGPRKAGKGVVVGVLDTGIWPESASFAGSPRIPRIPGWRGTCQAGEQFPRNICNSKVIGARYFNRAITSGGGEIAPQDYLSPRDGDGHGSHTASTAAGNHGVRMRIGGFPFGTGSGMAPAAKIAAYKVLWSLTTGEEGTGTNGDIVAAIDRAVRDGVDVINFSIGNTGGGDPFTDASNLAFMNAAAAGIFVAASAGNDGAPSTVGNNGPWMTTTAASTSFLYQGSVVLGNGDEYVGAMASPEDVPESPLVYAGDIAATGADPAEAALCGPDTLDPARAAGAVVVCDRGVYDRVAKSAEVARADGVGMVLTNVDPGSIDADWHSLPTVHLDVPDADAVRTYAGTPGATAAIDADGADDTPVPQLAGFSSQGPAVPGGGDILKPDIAAPGSSIVAAVAPPFHGGRRFDLISGTSMASPHIAGLGALIHRLRPHWTPMMIKSAMMTTAYNLKGNHRPFAQGAGHVRPRRFLDPGVVFDSRAADWLRFLAGQGVTTGDGDPIAPPIDASNLNQASIAIGDLVGTQRVRRTLTNVSGRTETYAVSTTGLAGLGVEPSSDTVRVPARGTAAMSVLFSATDDTRLGRYTTGKLVLTGDNGHVVRLPVAVRPIALSVPPEVHGEGVTGSVEVEGRAGFTGDLDLAVSGLVGSPTVTRDLTVGPFDPSAPTADADTYHETVEVPAGTGAVRFRTDADAGDDLDLWLYYEGALIGASATESGDEELTGIGVPAGTYDVYVNAYAAPDATATMRYDSWVVSDGDDAGNLVVAPDPVPVESGQPFSYTATWSGLTADQNWFGYVAYPDTGDVTVVSVD